MEIKAVDVSLNVPAIEKLLDYAASGVGSVAGSMFAPWRARRETQAKLIAAEGDAEVLSIQAEAQSKAREILVSQDTDVTGELNITDKVNQRILFQEHKRQVNIETVVRKSANHLGDKSVENREPDHDWTARFFNDIQDVSSEGMQNLWAKVLAGEVEKEGSTSIRTLGVLKNMDQATASLFRKFCSACIFLGQDFSNGRVPSLDGNAGSNSLVDYGLEFRALNRLNENGLIISDYNSWVDLIYCKILVVKNETVRIEIPFTFQRKHWILRPYAQDHDINNIKKVKDFRLSGVALTSSGMELSKIIDLELMEKFSQDLITYFQKKELQMIEVISPVPQLRR